jgi:hypothetical protein
MEFTDENELSEIQKKIILYRIEGKTYDQITSLVDPRLKHPHITTAIRRASLGLSWTFGMNGGPPEYLCPLDSETLTDIILLAAQSLAPLGIEDIIDEAYNPGLDRHVIGFKFLITCHSEDMAHMRRAEVIRMPSRKWV